MGRLQPDNSDPLPRLVAAGFADFWNEGMEMIDWQTMSAQQLEENYNLRVAVSDAQAAIERLTELSVAARRDLEGASRIDDDLRFGPGPLETLDLYRPNSETRAAPLAVFIHGGYWRALDKIDHVLVVPPLLSCGAIVANVNYDLCPNVTLDEIASQIVRAVRYCAANAEQWGADPSRLVLIGHSAGAHLAARVLNTPADDDGLPADLVAGVAAISGIYEPQVVTKISVNEQAQISATSAANNDCLSKPPAGRAQVVAWVGGDEPAGWKDQTVRYAAVAAAAGLPARHFVLPGTNHFTVLEESMRPGSAGYEALQALLA